MGGGLQSGLLWVEDMHAWVTQSLSIADKI